MARCRIPKFCDRYKISIGIYDPESKRKLSRSVKQRDVCLNIHKNFIVLFGKKLDEIVYTRVRRDR